MPADPWDLVRQGWLATGSSGATDDPYRMSEEPLCWLAIPDSAAQLT